MPYQNAHELAPSPCIGRHQIASTTIRQASIYLLIGRDHLLQRGAWQHENTAELPPRAIQEPLEVSGVQGRPQ